MKKIDMHVHCKRHSPDVMYAAAMARGMDIVAITDHHSIDNALYLKGKHDNILVGAEITVTIGGERLDVLVYNLNKEMLQYLNSLRNNFDDFILTIKENYLFAAPAHFLFSIKNKENIDYILSKFDVFEGINFAKDLNYCLYLTRKGKKIIAGTDSHTKVGVGLAYSIFSSLEDVPSGKCHIGLF